MYEMKEEFKTGIPFVDEQHKKLFDIAEETYQLLKNDFAIDKYDKILVLIDQLKDYSVYHFETEEKYMKEINYCDLPIQEHQHSAFIDKLNNFDLSKIDDDQDEYIISILNFLSEWLIDHIFAFDKKIYNSELK